MRSLSTGDETLRLPSGYGLNIEREAGALRVVVEHADSLKRVLVEVFTNKREFLQDVVGDGNYVAANLLGVVDVEEFARASPTPASGADDWPPTLELFPRRAPSISRRRKYPPDIRKK